MRRRIPSASTGHSAQSSGLRIPQAYLDLLHLRHTLRAPPGQVACTTGARFASIRSSFTSLAQRNAFMTILAIALQARSPTQVGVPCCPHSMRTVDARPSAGMQR
jgi:hypothetical protein